MLLLLLYIKSRSPCTGHSHSEDEEENEFEDAVEELAENFIVHVNTGQAHKRSSSNVSQVGGLTYSRVLCVIGDECVLLLMCWGE